MSKKTRYHVYGETQDGIILEIDIVSTEDEAYQMCITEENEHPENDYWWEAEYADEQ